MNDLIKAILNDYRQFSPRVEITTVGKNKFAAIVVSTAISSSYHRGQNMEQAVIDAISEFVNKIEVIKKAFGDQK